MTCYTKYDDMIYKNDLMAMFRDFHKGDLPIFHLNFGTIILLRKKEDAIQIQQYRPICLLNVSFKIFTKVTTNRVTAVAHEVIRPTQTAFMLGRHILEGVVILHETIHELHRKKLDGVLLKIDFKKGYNKVNWCKLFAIYIHTHICQLQSSYSLSLSFFLCSFLKS